MIHLIGFRKCFCLLPLLMLLLTPAFGEEESPVRLSEKYPDLPNGILSEAVIKELPDAELVHINGKPITRQMLAIKLADMPEEVRENAGNYLFYVLENMVTEPIMITAIVGDEDSLEDNEAVQQRIRTYIENIVGSQEVDEAESRKFFDENPEMFPEMEFEEIKELLAAELLRQKQQTAWETHIRSMGREIQLSINAAWVAEQAEKVKDNLVDKARAGDKPVLVAFSADWCPACKLMKPVLESLQDGKAEHATILVIDTDVHGFLASRYDVSSIPLLIFFDKGGNEVERKTGFMAEEDILEKLTTLSAS